MKKYKVILAAIGIWLFGVTAYAADEWIDITSNPNISVNKNCTVTVVTTDAAGNETTKTVTIDNIDDTKPTISVSGNPTAWSKKATISVTAKDTQSGVAKIEYKKGSGSYTDITSASKFDVTANATYTVRVTDNVGYTTTKTVTVSKIDTVKPTASISENNNWGNASTGLTFNITASDDSSSVAKIEYKQGSGSYVDITSAKKFVAKANATYTVRVTDGAGNTQTASVTVSKIDTDKPVVSYVIHDDGTFTVTASDDSSGVKSITVNGTTHTGDTATLPIPVPLKDVIICAADNVSNVSANITIPKAELDVIPPTLTVTEPEYIWTSADNGMVFHAAATDGQSGVAKLEYNLNGSGWVDVPDNGEIIVRANGTITIRTTDNADLQTEQSFTIDKIDADKPTITAIPSMDGTSLTITAEDAQSGLKSILVNGTEVSASSPFTYVIPTGYDWSVPLIVQAMDNATNVSESITFDEEIPPAQVPTVPDDYEYVPQYPFTFDLDTGVTDKDEIAKMEVSVNGNSPVDYTDNFMTNAPFIKDFSITEESEITIIVTDKYGRVTETTVTIGKLDDVAPLLTAIPSADGKKLNIVATDELSGIDRVSINDGDFEETEFVYTIPDDYDWSVPLTVKAYDKAQNSSIPVVFTEAIYEQEIGTLQPERGEFVNIYPTTVDITLDGVDPDKVAKVEVSTNGGEYVDYTDNFMTNAPKIVNIPVAEPSTLTVKVTDKYGREHEVEIEMGKRDITPPVIEYALSDDRTSVILTVTDDISGVKNITVNGTDNAADVTTYPIIVGTDMEISAADNAGNVSNPIVLSYNELLDSSAPLIEATIPTEWLTAGTPLDVPFTVSDDGEIAEVKYCIDNGEWVDITAEPKFTVTQNCAVTISATDKAGNTSTIEETVSCFDGELPTLDYDISQSGKVITWSARAKSGIRGIVINGIEYAGDLIAIVVNEAKDITAKAVNILGVEGEEITLSYNDLLDNTAPLIEADVPTELTAVGTPLDIPFTVTDDGEVAEVKYRIDDGEWVDVTDDTKFTVTQNCSVTISATDKAGNTSTIAVDITCYDSEQPTLTCDVSEDGRVFTLRARSAKFGIRSIIVDDVEYESDVLVVLVNEDRDIVATAVNNADAVSTPITLHREEEPEPDEDVPEEQPDDEDEKHSGRKARVNPYNASTDWWGGGNPLNYTVTEGEQGKIYTVNAKGNKYMPANIMDYLYEHNIEMSIKSYAHKTITIPAGKALPPQKNRLWYTLDDLAEIYGEG